MDNGAQILNGLMQTRKFYQHVALLIRTAEELLMKAGWESIGGRKSSNITSDYLHPERWIPRDIYRFYIESNEEQPGINSNLIAYTGVLLDQENAWAGFTEPWVTCGVYNFHQEFQVINFNYWTWVRAALDDKHEPDGSFSKFDFSESEEEEDDELLYQAVMALPLVRITDSESLNQLIIDPLLKKIAEIKQNEEEK